MKLVATNRKARHEYTIFESVEVGIVLVGTEVKSIREGRVNIADAYATIEGSEIVLHGMHISPYSHTSQRNLDPRRDRKLLLKRHEIRRLVGKVKEKGFTLIPLRLYFNDRGIAKIELGLARGKRMYDKRRDIAERDARREMDRALKEKKG